MVQAMINISKQANQMLNIVKARYNFKDKSQAIEKLALSSSEAILEPELRPEYIVKLKKIRKGKYTKFNSIEELRKATS